MIQLYFVGDGPRDGATLPRLVERILGADIDGPFKEWRHVRLHGKSGYAGKMKFAIRAARDAGASGLVAAVDADKDPQRRRLRDLVAGRDADRASAPPFPAAIEEAVPHADAWLLDDPTAIRQALQLTSEVEIQTVRQSKNPKATLQSLIEQSEIDTVDLLAILAAIAREVELSRCQHAKETGFKKFADEVRHELGSLATKG